MQDHTDTVVDDAESGQGTELTGAGTITFDDLDLTDDPVATVVAGSANASATSETGTDDQAVLVLNQGQQDALLQDALGGSALTIDPDVFTDSSGTVNWTYTVSSDEIDFLGAGDVATLTFDVNIDDGSGGDVTQTVTVLVEGTNEADDPRITSVDADHMDTVVDDAESGQGTELTGAGTITFDDLDLTDDPVATVVAGSANASATSETGTDDQAVLVLNQGQQDALLQDALGGSALTIDPDVFTDSSGTVNWTYTVSSDEIDFLGAGDVATLTFDVNIDDGSGGDVTQTVTVLVEGTNEADDPRITSVDADHTDTVVDDAESGQGTELTGAGTITFDDLDLTDDPVATVVAGSANASATSETGTDDQAVLVLNQGQQDALLQDALGGSALTIDPDVFTDSSGTVNWTYTVSSDEIDFLGAGDVATLTFDVNIDDGSGGDVTQTVTVLVEGTNEAGQPTISVGATDSELAVIQESTESANMLPDGSLTTGIGGTVTQGVLTGVDGDNEIKGTLTVTDVDVTDVVTVTVSDAVVSSDTGAIDAAAVAAGDYNTLFTATPEQILDGTETTQTLNWSFTGVENQFDYLDEGESVSITYTVTATDDNGIAGSHEVTIIVQGADDEVFIDSIDSTVTITEAAEADEPQLPVIETGNYTFTGDQSESPVVIVTDSSLVVTGTTGQTLSQGYDLTPDQIATLLGGFSLVPADDGVSSYVDGSGAGSWRYDYPAADAEFLGEGDNLTLTFELTIADNDGAAATGDTTTTVTINLVGANDIIEVTEVDPDPAIHVITEGQTTNQQSGIVGDILFTDIDLDDNIQPGISGNDIGTVTIPTIDDVNGSPGDYEANYNYNVAQGALEHLGEGETVSEIISISLTDGVTPVVETFRVDLVGENDQPFFDPGGESQFLVQENQTTVGTVAAFDIDTNDTITYSLVSGGDNDLFDIDEDTGEITFLTPPDFENPQDVSDDNDYNITVIATDDSGVAATESASRNFIVTVQPTSDEAPEFDAGLDLTPNVVEGDTTVGTYTATDTDSTPDDPVEYTLVAGVGDNDLFAIEPTTGALSFLVAPDFENGAGSGATANDYVVEITATDSASQSVTEDVMVSVTATSDEAPEFDAGLDLTPNVVEGDTTVGTYTATDTDSTPDDPVEYTLVAGVGDNDLFAIEPTTGALSFLVAPDFENGAGSGATANDYVVEITATDSASQSVTEDVMVSVTATSDEAPEFDAGLDLTPNVVEGDTTVGTYTATDTDSTPDDPVEYTLVAGVGDNDLFAIEPTTGALSFLVAPDFENGAGSGATANDYVVEITATDSASQSVTEDVMVSVTATSDEAPEFDAGLDLTPNVVEGDTTVGTYTATDTDSTPDDPVEYTLVAGVGDNDLFAIEPTTGALSFLVAPDFENGAGSGATANDYVVEITATDSASQSVTEDVMVSVTATSDEAPEFDAGLDLTPNVVEGDTTVGTYTATDTDSTPDDPVEYTLVAGVGDNDLFAIEPTTGALSFLVAPDFENGAGSGATANDYVVEITATDSASQSVTEDVTVTVTDEPEPLLITSAPSVNTTVAEIIAGTAIISGTTEFTGVDAGEIVTTPATSSISLSSPGILSPAEQNALTDLANLALVQAPISNGSGSYEWQYNIDQADAVVLEAGEQVIVTYVVAISTDGGATSADNTIAITINGSGDDTTSPVLIDLDGDGVEITQTNFDFDNDGVQESGGFTNADDGILAIDVNGDGKVNGVTEIALADMTEEDDSDLEALGTLIDENGDGLVDANDSGFDSLLIWQDANQDGIAQDGEVMTMDEAGIESISTEYFEGSEAYTVDGLANVLGESIVTFTDGTTTTAADAELIYSDAAIDFSAIEAVDAGEFDDLDIAMVAGSDAAATQSADPAVSDASVAIDEADEAAPLNSVTDGANDWLI